jgi:hypothetical protein
LLATRLAVNIVVVKTLLPSYPWCRASLM